MVMCSHDWNLAAAIIFSQRVAKMLFYLYRIAILGNIYVCIDYFFSCTNKINNSSYKTYQTNNNK